MYFLSIKITNTDIYIIFKSLLGVCLGILGYSSYISMIIPCYIRTLCNRNYQVKLYLKRAPKCFNKDYLFWYY